MESAVIENHMDSGGLVDPSTYCSLVAFSKIRASGSWHLYLSCLQKESDRGYGEGSGIHV